MQKACGVAKVITIPLLAFVALLRLIPEKSQVAVLMNCVVNQIENTPLIRHVVSVAILLLALLMLISILMEWRSGNKIHAFDVGSKKFCSFFSQWYSKAGKLSIFCDDLEDWVNPNGNTKILEVLRRKATLCDLQLFLGRESPEQTVEELRQLGATVKKAPRDIVARYSFSCLSFMGNHASVIVRNKSEDEKESIKFEEISNPYISSLLNALISEGVIEEKSLVNKGAVE